MTRDELQQRVARLGREFARRGMESHARHLRLYYLGLRRGLLDGFRLELHWSCELIDEWTRIFGWENGYDVRPARSRCRGCGGGSAPGNTGLYTEITFPGGYKVGCHQCGDAWIELEDDDVSARR